MNYARQGFQKTENTQIVLGLLLSEGGYPLTFPIHEDNKYEDHTMLPIVGNFVKKFNLKDFVVIADSALMNNDNIKHLGNNKYKYIIGVRIKAESEEVKQWILFLEKHLGCPSDKVRSTHRIVRQDGAFFYSALKKM